MAVITTLTQLGSIVGSTSRLANFITGGDLRKILSTISSVHFQAARTSLQHGRAEDAVLHLEVAYAAIRPEPRRTILTPVREIWDALSGTSGDPRATASAADGSECAALIASCYKALRREDQMGNWLRISANDADAYDTYLRDEAQLDHNQRKWGGGHYAKELRKKADDFKRTFNDFVTEFVRGTRLQANGYQV